MCPWPRVLLWALFSLQAPCGFPIADSSFGAAEAGKRFIAQAHLSLTSPVHGATYEEFTLIPVMVDVSLEEAWDRTMDDQGRLVFHVEVDRRAVEPLVLNASALPEEVAARTRAFALLHGLSGDNALFLTHRVHETLAQLACPLASTRPSDACSMAGQGGEQRGERTLCVAVDDTVPQCSPLWSYRPLTVRAPPGPHTVTAWLQGFPGRGVLHRSLSAFTVRPQGCHVALSLDLPRHGQHLVAHTAPLRFHLRGNGSSEEGLPRRLQQEGWSICIRLRHVSGEGPGDVQCVSPLLAAQLLSTQALPPGRIEVSAWAEDLLNRHKPSPVCPTTMSFQLEAPPPSSAPPLDASGEGEGGGWPLTFVTAISQSYYDEQRLQNLVGSIHFWEPSSVLEVYSLGLSPSTLADLHTWRHVVVRELDLSALPPHLGDWGSYAFKPIIVQETLGRHDKVFWIDANAELRRPLDEVRRAMQSDGHFFTTQPYDFPTPQFHHPHTVRVMGCDVADLSRQHCSTAFVGLVRDSFAHTQVWAPTVECALERDCINPPGSHRGNHRQEQTVANAAMCARNVSLCRGGMRWRLTSDFENDGYPLQPTPDETDWNDLVFYTRRNFPVKPYLRHLQRVPPTSEASAAT